MYWALLAPTCVLGIARLLRCLLHTPSLTPNNNTPPPTQPQLDDDIEEEEEVSKRSIECCCCACVVGCDCG